MTTAMALLCVAVSIFHLFMGTFMGTHDFAIYFMLFALYWNTRGGRQSP